jgi:hypothetical protein
LEVNMARIWGIALLAAAIWLLTVYGQSRPAALGPDAPATQFSAARADAVLGRLLGDQRPHPVGSQAAALFRARLLDELQALGVQARTRTATSCTSEPRWNNIPCATVTNITADVLPGTGKTILLTAHTDSVAAGPGAGDDGAGVATIVETIRALKARGAAAHPVTALFTDGEEDGLLGAAAWLREDAERANVGAVVNIEARGNQGPSYLFQTSKDDAGLIGLYAKAVPHVAASSLYAEIYRFMPNDTDLTTFLAAGIPGANFAFAGNVAHYHTPLDRRENIDPRSLQQHGENALELTDALRHADLARLQGGDSIYLDVLGRWLPRLPKPWSLPLSLAAFAVIALAGWLMPRERREIRRPVIAALMPPLLLAGCIAMGFALHYVAAWLSGHADPSYATPVWMRLSLGFGVFAVAILCARGAGAIACWLWLSFLAIVCALLSPGAAPYFLFPSLVAAPLLLATVHSGRILALWVSALVAMLLWIGLTASTEVLMGLGFTGLFTVTAGFGLIAVLPLLKAPGWGFSLAAALLLAVGLAVTAGLQPAFSIAAPQRLNIRYVEQDGKAFWLADPVEKLPTDLRAAADFSAVPRRLVERGYVAPAGTAQFPPPAATVSRKDAEVTLDFNAPGDAIGLLVPKDAQMQSLTLNGVTVAAPPRSLLVRCGTPDCSHARMVLRLASHTPLSLTLLSYRAGLPPEGAKLLKARPATAQPSQGGDITVLAAKLAVPGG